MPWQEVVCHDGELVEDSMVSLSASRDEGPLMTQPLRKATPCKVSLGASAKFTRGTWHG